jgi:hypothetical protein
MKSIILITLVILIGSSFASIVTLTGACNSAYINKGYLNFSIINKGNGTAYNLVLTPVIPEANLNQTQYNIGNLTPNSIKYLHIRIPNSNLLNGSYANYVIAAYGQGTGESFTAIFPCIISIGNVSQASVITSAKISRKGNFDYINTTIFNEYKFPINVTVSVLLPPSFNFEGQSTKNISIGAYQEINTTFKISFPIENSSYSGAVTSQYLFQNKHYATIAFFIINTSQIPPAIGPLSINNLLIIIVAVIIILLIILMARIFLRNKAKNQDKK